VLIVSERANQNTAFRSFRKETGRLVPGKEKIIGTPQEIEKKTEELDFPERNRMIAKKMRSLRNLLQ